VQARVVRACADALAAAPLELRRAALARLERVRAGMPTGAEVVRAEAADRGLVLLERTGPWWRHPIHSTRRDLEALRLARDASRLAAAAEGPASARPPAVDDKLLPKLLGRVEDAGNRLEVLIGAAAASVHRAENGRWPASVADLTPRAVGPVVQISAKGPDLELSAPLRVDQDPRFALVVRTGP
jgi:hypothetical protein